MTAIESTPIDVNEVLDAVEVFIKQRPRLEFGNYGSMAPYRAEIRSIAKDKKRAMEALAAVRRSVTQDPALLADAFKRAFSGRLEWKIEPTKVIEHGKIPHFEPRGRLEYTTGQYWPTEYRKAAASVLETYLANMRQKWADEHPQKFKFKTLAEVKTAHQAQGGHWFDRSTMRFFNCRIESTLMTRGSSGLQFFITSEQYDDYSLRKYTIREVLANADINKVGEFQQYNSIDDARLAVRLIA